MKCDEVDSLLVAYLYRDLEAERLRVIDAHLATCEVCRAKLEPLRAVRSDLDALAVPQVPPTDEARVRARAMRVSRSRDWAARLAIAAALLVAPLALVILISREIRYEDGMLLVRLRSSTRPPAQDEPQERKTGLLEQRVADLERKIGNLRETHQEQLVKLAYAVDLGQQDFLETIDRRWLKYAAVQELERDSMRAALGEVVRLIMPAAVAARAPYTVPPDSWPLESRPADSRSLGGNDNSNTTEDDR
ncbi:MAG: zf-HC2 domain-containing protein [Planctomycetota bacterium]